MSSLRPQDRKSLCRFTFAGGRQGRTPRSPHHPHFCSDHARKDSQACAADKLARELSYFFSGQYLSACDLSAALGRLLPAVVRGDIKPRSARTLAYLSQTLAQTIHLAEHEYTNAFGTDSWRRTVRNSVRQNFNYPLESTLTQIPASVDSKPLTQTLSLLDATLTKNTGGGWAPEDRRFRPGRKGCSVLKDEHCLRVPIRSGPFGARDLLTREYELHRRRYATTSSPYAPLGV